jgi:hypothetical protein
MNTQNASNPRNPPHKAHHWRQSAPTQSQLPTFRAALAVVKMAADPHPKSLRPFPTAAAEMEAAHGQLLASQSQRPPQAPTRSLHNPADPLSCGTPAATLLAPALRRQIQAPEGKAR